MTEKTHGQWQDMAARISPRTMAFIDGKFCGAADGKRFDSVNPATGETVAEVTACGAEDVDRAVQAARRAFNSGIWSRSSPAERQKVLLRLAGLIREHNDELALLETINMGKLVRDAATGDIPASASVFQWYAEAIDKVYDEIAPTAPGDLALVRREALGVIGAVVPWNFPLDMAAWKCAPALATGNSVVLKPAEQSPFSAIRLAELAAEAGLPDGVLNVVPGFGETAGRAIGLHMDVDCVGFTGSTETGKMFQQYAGQSNMKQVWLETGGKSPNIVFADCTDLALAAEKAAGGIFCNQGEVCTANSRLFVERSIMDEFMALLLPHAEKAWPGDPLDPASGMGAIVDARQHARIMHYIETGRQVARLRFGGESVKVNGRGLYIAPTIFTGVGNDSIIARDEIFGPVLAVIPFDSEEEVTAMANDTIYGLAASIWTGSLSRAIRMAENIRAGTVSVNTVDAVSPATPFGGFRQSGIGRDLSLHSLDKYTGLKTIWIKYDNCVTPKPENCRKT